jgi:hypothetical protein
MQNQPNLSAGMRPEMTVTFMRDKGWQDYQCSACGRIFFAKPYSQIDTAVCGSKKCSKEVYPFLARQKTKRLSKPAQINEKIRSYFETVGFSPVPSLNISNPYGHTDLVIAGVQMFDQIIHQNGEIVTSPMFVSQPSVRMQYQSQIATHEGMSTSFVNVCTEQMGASFAQHLQTVDYWCTALSKLGLHMNDFVIVMRTSENDWGTGKFLALELFFLYCGLELGDAAYFYIPQTGRAPIPISDTGFGLERIAWAVNKTDSYFSALRPITEIGMREMFDSCRTIALLALCGVQASNKGPGLQFRRFAKVLSEKYSTANLFEVVGYYIDYWTQFVEPVTTRNMILKNVQLEIDRFTNLRICKLLNAPPPRGETLEEYADRLVYTCNLSIDDLRNAVCTSKT